MKLYFKTMHTPVGRLYLVASDCALHAVLWQQEYERVFKSRDLIASEQHFILQKAQGQLEQYFLGQRQVFDLPIEMSGTEFQKKVWQALQSIAYGKTASYLEIATLIGNPKAVRAVGMANSRNLLSIIVPCHRVIGANGKMVGYAGGLDNKITLLGLERKNTE
ncbi:methylated-DNA--[protein]-cysteine S-methyltransferase [Acinetobacter sp. MD2(2019)]|uniref:methylated-DNA--[protein]-cysteine S-methyltransferase n=1 Tax=Acinetobacter sp. MD2(2019) TaxID=2605273 RepID=UPI002D1E8790|nr:methylated-DNA--[protein]-cysteine S-methyltransferase [Acinetobacter sp. MD2(2019)]MEB3753632.1 methylated-DNA--[protein]-cysteine S-methyltransferase [Acinetobacter sp. MD2(2019)]